MVTRSVAFFIGAVLFFAPDGSSAQPLRIGDEIRVNQATRGKSLEPMVVFGPSGSSVVVWENTQRGVMARSYDRNGQPTSAEKVLVGNQNLPGIPAEGIVVLRREPVVVALPNGELLAFWTEERAYLSVYYFWERRELLDQDVHAQRFSSTLAPLGPRIRINATKAGFQRRPRAALAGNRLVVVFESSEDGKNSNAVHSRQLDRRARPAGAEVRVDDGAAVEVWERGGGSQSAG
jgi:hypothetical protein